MSISSMSDAKLLRENARARRANRIERSIGLKTLVERTPPTAAERPQPAGVSQPVIQQLVRWIPTETLTLYVAWIAVLDTVVAPVGKKLCDASFSSWWWSVIVFTVLTPIIVFAIYLTKLRSTKQPFRWPVFEMGFATVAFAAWALALPNTPLQDFCNYKVAIGAFLVLAASIGIGLIAGATGHEPPSTG